MCRAVLIEPVISLSAMTMPFCLPFLQSSRAQQDEDLPLTSEKQPSYASPAAIQRFEQSIRKEQSRHRLSELRTLMQDNKIDY